MECIETFSLPWGGTVTLRKKLEAKVIPKQEPPKATGEVLDGPTTGELEKANDIATESRAWKLDNVREEVYRLAREFEEIERGRGYSAEQFSRMRRVFAAMRALGIAQRPFQNDLRKGSLGERLAAVAGCQVLPVDADVGFLFDLLRHLLYRRSESGPRKNYSPFVIYQSIIALMTLVEMDNKGEPGFVLADWQEQILERIWEIDLQELMTQVDDEGRQSLLCIVRRSQAVIAKKARESTEADERNRNRRIAEDERRKEILAGGDGPNIEFRKSGKIISWSSKAKDILELAEIHGIDIPWTCKSGSCSTCRTKLLSGKIKYNHTVHTSCGTDECLVCSCVPAGPIALDA